MREILDLLRHERRAGVFFAALTQSALGTGAGYVALLLIAYDRFQSPWAVSLVLVVDLVPAMLAGPLFGAAADRWSRKRCAVTADVVRVVAFAGVALVDSFAATLFFSLLAGVGTGLFTPAVLAGLPSVVDDESRVAPAMSLYGAIADVGFTLGPALAAVFLLFGGPELIMAANAVSFAASAVLLARLAFGGRPERAASDARPTLLAEAREGVRATAGMRGIRIVILGSSGALFCGGLFNVAELFFATGDLGADRSGFSVLVALFGLGFVGGSVAGSKGGAVDRLTRRYLTGLLVMGAGFLASGLAPAFAVAALTFAVAGFGNGLVLVYERLLIQTTVPDRLLGRVFGVKDALASWAFAVAFLAAGGIMSVVDARTLILAAGGIGFAIALLSAIGLRGAWPAATLDRGADAVRDGVLGQHGADVVGGRRGV